MKKERNMTEPNWGMILIPSFHGEKCPGNGEHPGVECCCDECDHYLECFPDWAFDACLSK